VLLKKYYLYFRLIGVGLATSVLAECRFSLSLAVFTWSGSESC